MRFVSYFATVLLAFILTPALGADTAVDRAKRDEIVSVPKGDPDMEAAFRQARETLKGFLELARARAPASPAWQSKSPSTTKAKPNFSGSVRSKRRTADLSAPSTTRRAASVTSSLGQTITFQTNDIVDWLYRENGKMFGNYTACALLKQVPPSERKAFAREYGLNCDNI